MKCSYCIKYATLIPVNSNKYATLMPVNSNKYAISFSLVTWMVIVLMPNPWKETSAFIPKRQTSGILLLDNSWVLYILIFCSFWLKIKNSFTDFSNAGTTTCGSFCKKPSPTCITKWNFILYSNNQQEAYFDKLYNTPSLH